MESTSLLQSSGRYCLLLTGFVLGGCLVAAPSVTAEQRVVGLRLKTRVLVRDAAQRASWETRTAERGVPANRMAFLICDMWDRHWSRGASERVDAMAPRLNAVAQAARNAGILIVHAPSETMDFYASSPARERATMITQLEPRVVRKITLPALPIDDSDGGSDTGETPWYRAWTRQHRAIEIDPDRDVISDNGKQIYSLLTARGIEVVLFSGVHTNMCVLASRTFSLKPLAEWGFDVVLVRDLTDAMYNPARAPYVSHSEGTLLVVEFIEKFLCPTISSDELLGALNKRSFE